ncbi:MAG: 3-isopropylmalate dehydratase large subunit [Alphaproteobacteria bacterium]|nr:3-isopropylmalate dehydratase large subunit [Alphaproteobacteria bacterium]
MTEPMTLFEKIWNRHAILNREDGTTLLSIDRHLCHEGSFHAFDKLKVQRRVVRRPDLTVAIADHYVSTVAPETGNADPSRREVIERLTTNTEAMGVRLYGVGSPEQGIVHVVGPEQGITLPGLLLVCGDSHTATHGALGCLAFGIGASEVAHVLATQTLWQKKPKALRVTIDGPLGPGVSAKDVVLHLIAVIGANGATGHMIEYAGSTIEEMSMEGRMTVCNMSIEAGARAGLIAPDDKTFAYLKDRRYAPKGLDWERALADWGALASDLGARFDREVSINAGDIAPSITWGTSPEEALAITGRVPDPVDEKDPSRRAALEVTLDYMGLQPGAALTDIVVDRVFIGSCTNGRMEDLRAAAAIVEGRVAKVTAIIVPGSTSIKLQAEAEGLDRIFIEAGFEWRATGCSMCVGMNGDLTPPGERCASTSNRNFKGRQGPGSRTHLMSPAMAAAAAVTGRLADVRDLIGEA